MKTSNPFPGRWTSLSLALLAMVLTGWRVAFAQILPPSGDLPASVVLLYPTAGQTVTSDSAHFEAVATDPDGGPLTYVEFVVDGRVVGISDRSGDVFPTVLGLKVPHKVEWPTPAAGTHVIQARALVGKAIVAESAPIRVIVAGGGGASEVLPVVQLLATRPTTSEPSPLIRIAPGLFTVTRKGDASQPVTIRYTVGGTAKNGVDYEFLDGDLTLGAGETSGEILVGPIDDGEFEGTESVEVKLVPDPAYQIGAPAAARIAIFDTSEPQDPGATLKLTQPESGSGYLAPADIQLALTAVDPAGYIARVEFLANGRVIGVSELNFFRAPDPGTPIKHAFEWKSVPPGAYAVSAVAVDTRGARVMASPLRVIVKAEVEPPRVVRHPADAAPADDVVSADEFANYAALWRKGGRTDADIGEVPIGYMTRAGFLWKAGGGYRFNASLLRLPQAWVSTDPTAEPRPGIDFLPPIFLGGAIDFGTNILPRIPVSYVFAEVPRIEGEAKYPLVVRTGPRKGIRAQAVEIQFAAGTELAEISDDGHFDAQSGILRWGPFLDDAPRQLTAVVATPAPLKIRGMGSFDGTDTFLVLVPVLPTTGANSDAPRIATLESLGNGGVQVVVVGGTAGAETDVEVSTDLVRWTRIGRMPVSPNGSIQMDGDAGTAPVRFYRALKTVK